MSDYHPTVTSDARCVFDCGCGREYELKKHRFFEISDGGKAIPYMQRNGFSSSWLPVEEEGHLQDSPEEGPN